MELVKKTKEASIENLSTATVHMKSILPEKTQKFLLELALDLGKKENGDSGFYKKKNGEYLLNMDSRGRIYREITDFPEYETLTKLCSELVDLAQEKSKKLPDMKITHLLLLYYSNEQGMSWHRDSDENDGDNDHPIVSISLGSTCTFGLKPLLKEEKFVNLESGDVLIWGGPERMLEHSVDKVKIGTSPFENLPGRLNFTFRSAPNIVGREKEFSTSSFWVDQ
eukprot:gene5510-9327_t